MASRSFRADLFNKTGIPGASQLILAKWIVAIENIAHIFARPLMLLGFFVALAWLGVFTALYPWAHLAALILFAAVLFDALGKARARYRSAPPSAAKRRVEAASGLSHRPFDVLDDRSAVADDEQQKLWRLHVAHSRTQLNNLRWPRWKLAFADGDPYALRYALLILLAVGATASWGVWGGRMLAAINPALGPTANIFKPALDAWITPPEYTGLPPVMIATPAGVQRGGDVIEVPEGSTITAHLAEKSGDAPALRIGGQSIDFAPDDHSDFGVTAQITSGDTLSIRRGWEDLGSWRIHVVPDQPPKIAFTEAPSVSEQKSVRLAWQASDDYGVASVSATITPRESLPGASTKPVEITLAAPDAKDVKRVSFEDLTASPWAGLAVRIQLSATNAAGHKAESDPADFILPERIFFNPLARALVEERKKLLQSPDDDNTRDEVANVMAAIAAHHAADYRNDPVVLMSLRSGAVRLVLDRSESAVPPVTDILWQTAARIEDGGVGAAAQNLRVAQKELADALDRGADQAEIQNMIDRLHTALTQYLAQLSMRAAAQPPMSDELKQALGAHTNMLTPQDLDRMLEQMRDLSASGKRDAAREELAKLQQLLESLNAGTPQLNAKQQEALKRIAGLRDLSHRQQQLLDKTFQDAQGDSAGAQGRKLALEQEDLRRVLRSLIDGSGSDATDDLNDTDQAMKDADASLGQGALGSAMQDQNKALAALQKAVQNMADSLRASMFMLPRPGMAEDFGQGQDPFGRFGFGGFARDDGGVTVPDRMEMRRVREILNELQRRAGDSSRSKAERDYIDRLLQNF